MRTIAGIACIAAVFSLPAAGLASTAKFDIPGDFPGQFQIDFLGTAFKLNGNPSGSLSTESTIRFSVGSETAAGSGIYATTVSPDGFNFVDFEPLSYLPFDVYGAGVGQGIFDTNTGHWEIDMPTLFVVQASGDATRIDMRLTTHDVTIPDGFRQGYTTSWASPMVLDEGSVEPWGDLRLVAAGLVPHSGDIGLDYDADLIAAIGASYAGFALDTISFVGVQYEFDIYGNDPLVSVPLPAAGLLFGSCLLGVLGFARRRAG